MTLSALAHSIGPAGAPERVKHEWFASAVALSFALQTVRCARGGRADCVRQPGSGHGAHATRTQERYTLAMPGCTATSLSPVGYTTHDKLQKTAADERRKA